MILVIFLGVRLEYLEASFILIGVVVRVLELVHVSDVGKIFPINIALSLQFADTLEYAAVGQVNFH